MISRLYLPLMILGSRIDFERTHGLHFHVLSFDDFGTLKYRYTLDQRTSRGSKP